MQDFWNMIVNSINRFTLGDAVDILLVTVILYYVLKFASQTRAMQVLKGMGIILVIARLSDALGLMSVSWIFNYIINIGAVLIIVLFQPELRRAFEQIGRSSHILGDMVRSAADIDKVTEELVLALTGMAKRHTGALVVVVRQTALEDIAETGTLLGADVSAALLETIFYEGTALHDGAVIIEDGYIKAAGCFLPLSKTDKISKKLGTRHRAALGMSENSDSVVFVVSEETGMISCARGGELEQGISASRIRAILQEGSSTATRLSLKSRIQKLRGKEE